MINTIIELNPVKLAVSVRYQARKTPGQQPLPELADSIAAQGLLQNLVVAKAKKRGMYEVVAGGRRLQAIQLLISDGRWPEGQTVHALLVESNSALEASITENVQREAMHPADEFEAFAALIDQGKSIEDVAARFAVSPQVVKRRMRLAGVAPELIDAYLPNQAWKMQRFLFGRMERPTQRALRVRFRGGALRRRHSRLPCCACGNATRSTSMKLSIMRVSLEM